MASDAAKNKTLEQKVVFELEWRSVCRSWWQTAH